MRPLDSRKAGIAGVICLCFRKRMIKAMGRTYESNGAEEVGVEDRAPFQGVAVCYSLDGGEGAVVDDQAVEAGECFQSE